MPMTQSINDPLKVCEVVHLYVRVCAQLMPMTQGINAPLKVCEIVHVCA